MSKPKKPRKSRRATRSLAVQALYQWQIMQKSAEEVIAEFLDDHDLTTVDMEYFVELVKGVINQIGDIDAAFKPFLARDITELNTVELSVLRLATYEFMHRPEIPYRVVLNEALEVTKTFGTVDGYKFVNGVLDKAVRTLRKDELST